MQLGSKGLARLGGSPPTLAETSLDGMMIIFFYNNPTLKAVGILRDAFCEWTKT